jgi:hypothetical protein
MTRYLISFNEGAMTFPPEDLPAVAEASHAVVREAKAAGVWIFGAGLLDAAGTTVVRPDGSASDGPAPGVKDFLGGFSIIECESREEALVWAAKIAESCRCDQDLRELMFDPES